ncbi:hypothetical protein CORC01_06633 [Colletotrichum orchidophilum]|uniref:Uncharacterized protein n=1 Tax=Colletotrichum orchidophilum TaxID=1209926 RepID=A0A1G4B9Q4_9PEZI|nr:uncharacterized protein CORC01_06633 [Colletotrichum orchidophilum]OHE98119.1 hypothetical protein CORC01_06633 [Colletotrichum orchidophilum]
MVKDLQQRLGEKLFKSFMNIIAGLTRENGPHGFQSEQKHNFLQSTSSSNNSSTAAEASLKILKSEQHRNRHHHFHPLPIQPTTPSMEA